VTLCNIAVLRDARGKPHIECAPELEAWLKDHGIGARHVSLSDEGNLVLAYVILERT
jgi:holo-[acyl-carrier protein] synthase